MESQGIEDIIKYFPTSFKFEITEFWYKYKEKLQEIRIRVNRPISLKIDNVIELLSHIVTTEEIVDIFTRICENSVYSYNKQICEGFITIKGGHRVGITGNCVIEEGRIINIRYISSLNFRIAREKKGCSNQILKDIIDMKNKSVYNTLIVSKPGAGKTTILRDIIKNLSNGIPGVIKGKTCGLIDERGEIAAMYKGIPQNDVGKLTDVLDNISKSSGMSMLIRSMAPEIIFCDEIGSKEDVQAINYAVCSGVKGVFTAHGDDLEEVLMNNNLFELLNKFIIEKIIFLDGLNKGYAKEVYELDRLHQKYIISK